MNFTESSMDYDILDNFESAMNTIFSEFIICACRHFDDGAIRISPAMRIGISEMIEGLNSQNNKMWNYNFNAVVNFLAGVSDYYSQQKADLEMLKKSWAELPFLLKWRFKKDPEMIKFIANLGLE